VTVLVRFAFLLGALCLAAAPARAVPIERVISPGGIEAWLVRQETLPLISVEFAFAGGASQDPADKPGVANMVGSLLDEGAGDLISIPAPSTKGWKTRLLSCVSARGAIISMARSAC
jgi:hypothetical protein